MTETLYQMLRRVPEDDILDTLLQLDLVNSDEIDAYLRVIQRLKEDTDPDIVDGISSIVVDLILEDDRKAWGNVSGIDAGCDQKLAIEFEPWPKWLPAKVIRGLNADQLTDGEVLAYILWEMTWVSDDPDDIAKRREEVVSSVKRLRNLIDETE